MPEEVKETVKEKKGGNKDRATVSVAIVAKNEEKTIIPCLKSVRDVVDEIVVLVDDTTTDRTFELAESRADTVDHYKWAEDFADARNQAIACCTKEWILIMDAHEILHPKSKDVLTNLLYRVTSKALESKLAQTKEGDRERAKVESLILKKDLSDTEIFSAFIYMNPKGSNIDELVPDTFFMQPRLFKNNGMHKYVGRVHNWLATKKESNAQKRPVNELVFIHKKPEEITESRKIQRADMNVRLLKEDIKEKPGWARPHFYLANTYHEMKKFDESLETFEKYLELSDWGAERAHAMLMMATICGEQKDYKKAEEILKKAIAEDWERAEIYCLLGDIAYDQKKFYQAEHWWKSAIDMKPPLNGLFLHGPAYTYMPYEKLAKLYSAVGEWMKAYENAKEAIRLQSPDSQLPNLMIIWKQRLGIKPDTMKIVVYDEDNRFTFLSDIRDRLAQKYNVATSVKYQAEYAKWGDIVWFEWCNQNVVEATSLDKPKNQKWIVRLHGFELINKARLMHLDWSKVDALVFVAQHVKQHFMETQWLPESTKSVVIHNGVNMPMWSFARREFSKSKNIGIIGMLTDKKGPLLLAKVIRRFAKVHPEYKFLLRLDVPRDVNINVKMLEYELRGLKNYEWVPRVESINSWMENLKFLISTSILESFSYVVAEAMAKGIKPLIHDFRGSRNLWPEELIWRDMDELDKVLEGNYDSKKYRMWIDKRYSLDGQMEKIEALMKELYGSIEKTDMERDRLE